MGGYTIFNGEKNWKLWQKFIIVKNFIKLMVYLGIFDANVDILLGFDANQSIL